MFGDGPNVSKLIWPSGQGMEIIQNDSQQGISIRDLSFQTGASGAGSTSALKLTGSGNVRASAQSEITRVTFQGFDGGGPGSDYWSIGCEVNGWECINFDTMLNYGAQQQGIGTRLTGMSASDYDILYNFKGCLNNYCDTGLLYDNWTQGVTVSGGCNFNQCRLGIHSPASAQGVLAQLKSVIPNSIACNNRS